MSIYKRGHQTYSYKFAQNIYNEIYLYTFKICLCVFYWKKQNNCEEIQLKQKVNSL